MEQDSTWTDNMCVAGKMSTLNVGKSRRRLSRSSSCPSEDNLLDLSKLRGSPDSFNDSFSKDTPLESRMSSPDLGYSGTPVMEIESSAELDEALNVSVSSTVSGYGDLMRSPPMVDNKHDSPSMSGSNGIRRPVPHQAAFDRKSFGSPSFANRICPATPQRATLLYANAAVDDDSTRRLPPIALARQNSLVTNKVLMSQSELPEDVELSFHRDFEDEGILGSGQFSTVFLGRAKDGSNRICAIKKLNNQFRSRKERDFHLNEVRIMERIGKIPCPYVIHFFTAWQEDGHLYVDIEFAANGTLRDLLLNFNFKKERFTDGTVWCVLHDVASGLKHIHACGFVHLDIKPANILIGGDGVLKIGDFGNAVEIGEDRDGSEGDTRYMPAELLESSFKEPSADVFSLGLTAYELCLPPDHAGLPLEGEAWHDLREERAAPLQSRGAVLKDTITSSMRRNPSTRITTHAILELPEANLYKSSEDPALLTAKPNRPLFSRFSSSLSAINTNVPSADDDRVMTPITTEEASPFSRYSIPIIRSDEGTNHPQPLNKKPFRRDL